MHKLFQSVLLGGAIALTAMAAHSADKSKNSDVSISAAGVNVDVGLGGRKGLNAEVDGDIGARNAVDADVSLGGKNTADVNAAIGGKDGVNADVSLGTKQGVDATVNAGIGDDVNVDVGVGVDDTNTASLPNAPAVDPGTDDPGTDPGGSLTSAQRQAFNTMSTSDRKALLKRCGSVGAGGYDPALVQLCKLLRMSASR